MDKDVTAVAIPQKIGIPEPDWRLLAAMIICALKDERFAGNVNLTPHLYFTGKT